MKNKRLNAPQLKKHTPPQSGDWMCVLAQLAAESRSDGKTALRRLAQGARYDERVRMSLQKHLANDDPAFVLKRHAA